MDSRPLFFGRLSRILLGVGLCVWLYVHPPHGLVLQGILLFFGISLVLGGVMGYAGCEVLAIPNLLTGKRMQCY